MRQVTTVTLRFLRITSDATMESLLKIGPYFSQFPRQVSNCLLHLGLVSYCISRYFEGIIANTTIFVAFLQKNTRYIRRKKLFLVLIFLFLILMVGLIYRNLRIQGHITRKFSVKPQHGYLLTLDYSGQIIAGVRALLSQQCWVKSYKLPLAIVEPFSNNSRLGHSHSIWYNDADFVRFSNHFNLQHFNAESIKSESPPITSWEEFIQMAPRRIILVTIKDVHCAGCLSYEDKMCRFVKQNLTLLTKFFTGCVPSYKSRMALKYLEKKNFHIVRNVCLNCHHKISSNNSIMSDLITRHIFGPYEPKSITIIVNQWRFSMNLVKSCGQVPTCRREKEVLPQRFTKSPTLLKDAERYIMSNFGSKKIIAIMIRIEWYIITHKKENDAIKCLQKILDIVNKYQSKSKNKESKIFLSMDIGAYGSGTFKYTLLHTNTSKTKYNRVLNEIHNFVKNIYKDTWTFNDWEDSFKEIPGIPNERGYIATLQGTIASKADCLVLMGGGHFQHLALHDYLDSHTNKQTQCVEYVCMAPAFNHLFNAV